MVVWRLVLIGMMIYSSFLCAAAPIKLGMSAPLTGTSQALGQQLLLGIRPVFDSVNRSGGINGRPIQLIVKDDQYKPDITLLNTVQFIREDRVDALFAYVGTPTVARILPLLRRSNTLLLYFPFTGAQPQRVMPYAPYVRNFRASYYDETRQLVRYFHAKGLNRIAVMYQIDAYGRNGWYGVKLALDELGLSMVSEATYRRGSAFSESYADQVRLILSGRPDAVIVIGSYQASAGFIRDLRASGTPVPVANISFVGVESLMQLLRPIPGATDHLVFSHVVPNPIISQTMAARDFRRQVQVPTFGAFEGYLDARLMVEILKNPEAQSFSIGLDRPVMLTDSDARGRVYLSMYLNHQWQSVDMK